MQIKFLKKLIWVNWDKIKNGPKETNVKYNEKYWVKLKNDHFPVKRKRFSRAGQVLKVEHSETKWQMSTLMRLNEKNQAKSNKTDRQILNQAIQNY